MKKVLFFLAIMIGGGIAMAQLPNHLTRTVLATVSENELVDDGEFQVELLKTMDYKETTEGFWFSHLYVTRNKYNQQQKIMVNGNSFMWNRNLRIRAFRVGASMDKSIFVIKNMDTNADDIGYNMEMVIAWSIPYMVCDTVVDINDDGFVYGLDGKYQYCPYKAAVGDLTQTKPVVWPVKKAYDGDNTKMPDEQKALFAHLPKGAPYYESSEGHYYFLFRDEYMPYSILAIDNRVVELFDQYTEDNFKLKFSYNGKHWMAVGKECYWVDGTMRSIDGFSITDFVVTNNGQYGYKAVKNDASQEGEVVVADGQVIRRNAQVSFFGLDAQGRLKFRFYSGGRYLQYENESVTDVSDFMRYAYYPNDQLKDIPMTVLSNDGLHKLTYQKDKPGVTIDGTTILESVPCMAVYDERNRAFVWNAVETNDNKTELVIYRYSIVNNIFQKIFK